ncbi:MAG: hypothetical protein LRY31_01805, partial [Burkholderiaceae bacterium]|nr:hypothetical protein [Burkholderiaceae bacterium]
AMAGNPHDKAFRACRRAVDATHIFCHLGGVGAPPGTTWQSHETHAILELSRLILLRHKSWELRRYQSTLRQFLEKQEQDLLKDRARMALLVHDQLGQLMAAARIKISAMTHPGVQSAKDDLEEAMEMTRNLSHRLYPLALRHGLLTALDSLVEDFVQRTDVVITLQAEDGIPPREGTGGRGVLRYCPRGAEQCGPSRQRHARPGMPGHAPGLAGNAD